MNVEIAIMRVIRVPPMSRLNVEVGSRRYEALAEVEEPEARERLMAAIGELIVFAGGYQRLVDAGYAPPVVAPATQAEARGEDEPLTPEQAAFLASLKQTGDLLAGDGPPRVSILPGRSRRPVPPPELDPEADDPASPEPQSIAAQIDAILQQRLAEDPALSGRRVELRQAATGGLIILVDDHQYARPGQIPDPAVQLLIKKALKEWEGS